MEETTKRDAKAKLKGILQKHWKVLAVVVLAAAFLITAMLLNSSRKRQNEVEEQLERQNALVAALQEKKGVEDSKKEEVKITSDILEEQLGSIRELVTQEYIYTNADRRESTEKWLWGIDRPFSGNSLLLTYDGTIKAGVDLSQVKIVVDEDKRTITVTLPPSEITDNNIPQESITVVEVKDGLFNKVTFDNYNEFIAEQKIIMEKKAIDQGILTKADKEAKDAVTAVLSLVPGVGDEEGEYHLEVN